MRLRRESKHSGKVDAQSLQALALAQLTWGAYNKQSKQVLKIGGFYQDFLRHIRLELLDYYEKVTAGDPTRTDLYKLNHYRRLEKGLVKEIKALGVKEQALGEKLLKDTIKDVYEASSFGQSAPVHLWEAIKSEQWDMSRFSDLVWKQKETLRRALIGDIRYGLASGMPIGDLAQRLQKSTGQSEFNAYRLVRNESMIASHHAKHRAYKDLGVEKVRIVVALDERTCEICSAQAGEVMNLDEALNRLPFHVMCRCTYVAVTKDNELVTEKDLDKMGMKEKQNLEGKPLTVYVYSKNPLYSVSDYSPKTQETIDLVDEFMNENQALPSPSKIVITSQKHLGASLAGYSHTDGVLFISNELAGGEILQSYLTNPDFVSETVNDALTHEWTHISYRNSVKAFYEENKSLYTTYEEAKQVHDEELRRYAKLQNIHDPNFISKEVSKYASTKFNHSGQINEIVAEYEVRLIQGKAHDPELIKLVKGATTK